MSRVTMAVWVLLTLIGAGMATTLTSQAQERMRLDAVEPPEGRPGQQLELTLLGGGFGGAREARVAISGVEVLEARIVSDERVTARVFIPQNAPPGPRPVEVIAIFGNQEFSARLEAGFFVLGPVGPPPRTEPPPVPPQPPPPNGAPPIWIAIVVVGLLLLISAVQWAGKRARPSEKREPKKPQIRVQPHADMGSQQVDADFLTQPTPEIHLKTVRGHVDSTIEPDPKSLID